MAGPTTAGRPCQPTNPPPKRYKPPKMTKSQQSGNPQQQYIDPKIIDSHCGASTKCYVTTYGHNSTRTKKPTMILPNTGPLHMIQKNQEKYATGTVFKKFTTTTDKYTKESTSPLQPTYRQTTASRKPPNLQQKSTHYPQHMPKITHPQRSRTTRKFQANLQLTQGPIAHRHTDTSDPPSTQISPPIYSINPPAKCQTNRPLSRRSRSPVKRSSASARP